MIILKKSTRKGKKYMAILSDGTKVHFGAKGYSDYTKHKNEERKKSYIARHRPREDWSMRGIQTAGWWAYYLLWNKKSIKASIKDIERRFGVSISNEIK